MTNSTVSVAPAVIRWARERSGQPQDYLERHFPTLTKWEVDGAALTIARLEELARRTHTPIGNFFLQRPPTIDLGIPDFRTWRDESIKEPSSGLVDTIAKSRLRQAWYRDYALDHGLEPVELVGSVRPFSPIAETGARLRALLRFEAAERQSLGTLDDVYRLLSGRLDDAGILVMKNGIVGTNTHRPLSPHEFRGFALSDDYAPLVFVNGADTRSANLFTLCHELVHIAIGQSALTNNDASMAKRDQESSSIERWCNRVAAEIMVPEEHLASTFDSESVLTAEIPRLGRVYKASGFVVLQSLKDSGLIARDEFRHAYHVLEDAWANREAVATTKGGGDFYRTQTTRLGRRFATAVIVDAREGRTLYSDAYALLATQKHQTFEAFAQHLGVP